MKNETLLIKAFSLERTFGKPKHKTENYETFISMDILVGFFYNLS